MTEAAQKKEKVDEGFLSHRFYNLARMAPATVVTLANPLAWLGVGVKKIAEKDPLRPYRDTSPCRGRQVGVLNGCCKPPVSLPVRVSCYTLGSQRENIFVDDTDEKNQGKPDMTRVLADASLLSYQREMVDTIRDILKWRSITGVNFGCSANPVLAQPRLLPPPSIDLIDLILYQGPGHNHILIATGDDFGVESVYVRIRDGEGNLIESGDAMPRIEVPGIWNYFATTRVPPGTTLTIYAAATDRLGAVGTCSVHLTIL